MGSARRGVPPQKGGPREWLAAASPVIQGWSRWQPLAAAAVGDLIGCRDAAH